LDTRAWEYLEILGGITDELPGLTRTFLSPALERAKQVVARWMEEAGLTVFEDQAGNLIGRWDCGDPHAGTFVVGSHLDTVRDAGRFDGALGVVLGVLAARRLKGEGVRRSHHLEVVGFSDEEGVRFQTTYLGSRHYCGTLGEREKAFADSEGITVEQAIAAHRPRWPLPPPRRVIGYVEAHIEQGPVLEKSGLGLGVATAIAGQTRARVVVEGEAGHAGTTPMHLRKDALAGAAECIVMIEQRARETDGIVATVGEVKIRSAASNVIPGRVEFTIDLRSADDSMRARFSHEVFVEIESVAKRRGLAVQIDLPLDASSTNCSPVLCDRLAEVVRNRQGICPMLVSGAGHDAVALAEVAPTALLFVRCRGGLSHHPDEYASPQDVSAALDVLVEFLKAIPEIIRT